MNSLSAYWTLGRRGWQSQHRGRGHRAMAVVEALSTNEVHHPGPASSCQGGFSNWGSIRHM